MNRATFGAALSLLLLFSYVLVLEVKPVDFATGTQTPSSISDTNSFEPSLWYSPDGSLSKGL